MSSANRTRDSSVDIVIRLRSEPRGVGVPLLTGSSDFHLLYNVQVDSGAHSASYPFCTGGSFPVGKAAGA
jgi:hypothetical protein